jgi:hypothetical protein
VFMSPQWVGAVSGARTPKRSTHGQLSSRALLASLVVVAWVVPAAIGGLEWFVGIGHGSVTLEASEAAQGISLAGCNAS